MTVPPDPQSPPSRIDDVPRILIAMRKAVREALLAHKRAGNSIVVWEDGKVRWLKPEEIPVDEQADEGTESGLDGHK